MRDGVLVSPLCFVGFRVRYASTFKYSRKADNACLCVHASIVRPAPKAEMMSLRFCARLCETKRDGTVDFARVHC